METDASSLVALAGAVSAIALPWLAGWFAVALLPALVTAHVALRLAIGFLVGQLLLLAGMALGSSLLGHWSVSVVLGLMCAAGIAGAVAGGRYPGGGFDGLKNAGGLVVADGRLLAWALLGLCAAHLMLTTVEILHRPVYPWDAWLNWMYRAKAWYFADSWLAFDTPDMWLGGVRENGYAVSGRHYPPLVPVTAVWMAIWTGGWTETLINLPTLALGCALVLGVYGLVRESGALGLCAALGAYLLMSLPLLGTHLSLAGMADAWMAGYAGIGLGCVFLGLYRDQRPWIAVGLALVALSRLVKLEGTVWLLAAMLIVVLVRAPRLTAGALMAMALLAVAGMLTDVTAVDLPLMGPVGIIGDRVYVPFIGNFALANWQLLDDYRDNFLAGGSWHLLWVLLAGGWALLIRHRQWRLAWLVGASLLSMMLALVGIFQFTEQGAWAEDWSAINRLPLHFTPLLCLVLALMAQHLLQSTPVNGEAEGRASGVALLCVSLMVATTAFFMMTERLGRAETGEPLRLDGRNLTAVLGSVERLPDGALGYTGFQDGIAVLSSGEIHRDAEAASLLTVVTRGSNREAMTFFWRNADSPAELQTVYVDERGAVTLDLAAQSGWSGQILEMGITAFDVGGSLALEHMTLAANDGAAQRRKAILDWLTPNHWSQRSVNWVDAGSVETRVSLPLLLAIAVVVALILALLPIGADSAKRTFTGALILALWLALDARWMNSRQLLARQTVNDHPLITSRALEIGHDRAVREAALSAAGRITGSAAESSTASPLPAVVALGSEAEAELFQRLRARYHLLPQAGLNLPDSGSLNASVADYLLVLKSALRAAGEPDSVAAVWTTASGNWPLVAEEQTFTLLNRRER